MDWAAKASHVPNQEFVIESTGNGFGMYHGDYATAKSETRLLYAVPKTLFRAALWNVHGFILVVKTEVGYVVVSIDHHLA